jgi:hypothetical protein
MLTMAEPQLPLQDIAVAVPPAVAVVPVPLVVAVLVNSLLPMPQAATSSAVQHPTINGSPRATL